MNATINPQSPESVELIDFIHSVGNLNKHLRKVFEYAVSASTRDGIPGEICNSLAFLSDLNELIEKVENQ
jgi:hypothetical protein